MTASLHALLFLLFICAPAQVPGQGVESARPPEATGAPLQDRRMAITFDDLPLSYSAHTPLEGQQRITRQLVRAITDRGILAVGFVNESKLEAEGVVDPARVALLRAWVEAGLELGNHTYSHPDLHRVPLSAFVADLERGEAVTRKLLEERGGALRWFRHPFLHTGLSLAVRDSLHGVLRDRGYRVAPVTIDNSEYIYAAAYDAALAAGDEAAGDRIVDAYLAYMMDVVAYYEQQSDALFGRNIPHVLLVHANALNGRAFGSLADRLAARGYAFVPLEEAVADPAYASPDEYAGPGGITWLHRWALTAGKRGDFFAGEPEVPDWVREAAARR